MAFFLASFSNSSSICQKLQKIKKFVAKNKFKMAAKFKMATKTVVKTTNHLFSKNSGLF
jgi:hypothetical protein